MSSNRNSNRQLHIVLASSSPRRRELLADAGYDFSVVPPQDDVECGVCSEAGPAGLVVELAYRKAAAVQEQLLTHRADGSGAVSNPQPKVILAADTVAECNGVILGKPRDEAEARAMLRQLSGREHRVLTGLCLLPFGNRAKRADNASPPPADTKAVALIRLAVTKLRADRLTDADIDEYIDSGQWEGKAGGFGYQDRLGWIHVIEGSESNVVGLPMELLGKMLTELKTDE